MLFLNNYKISSKIYFDNKIYRPKTVNKTINKISSLLVDNKVSHQQGVLIICKYNHYLLIPAVIGILKNNCIYSIIKSNDRFINYKINILKPSIILNIGHTEKYSKNIKTIDLTEDFLENLTIKKCKNNQKFDSENYMYVTFTSGSTSVPKIIYGKYKPIINFFDWFLKRFDFSDVKNFYLSASIDHDPFIRNIFTLFYCQKI